jgi:hypothetical protein
MFNTTRFKIPRTEKVQNLAFPPEELFKNYGEIKAIFSQISQQYSIDHIEILKLFRKYLTGLEQERQYAAELNFLANSLQNEQLVDTPIITNTNIIRSCKNLLGAYLRVLEGENSRGVSDSDDSMKPNHYISSQYNTQTYEQSLAIQPIYKALEKDLQSSTELKANVDSEFITPAEQDNPKDLFDDIYGKISASADLLGQSRQKVIENLQLKYQGNTDLVNVLSKLLGWQDEYYFGGNISGSDNINFEVVDNEDLLLLQGYVTIYFDETVLYTINTVPTTPYVAATSTNTYKSTQNRPSAQTPLSSASANIHVNSAVNTNHTSNAKHNQSHHLLQKLGDLKNSVGNQINRFKNFGQNTLRQTFSSTPKNNYKTVKSPANNPAIPNTVHAISNTPRNIKSWYANANWKQKTGVGLASVLGIYGFGVTSINTAMSNLTGRQFHAPTEFVNFASDTAKNIHNYVNKDEIQLATAREKLANSYEIYFKETKEKEISSNQKILLEEVRKLSKQYIESNSTNIDAFPQLTENKVSETVMFDPESFVDEIPVNNGRISLTGYQKDLIIKYIELQNILEKNTDGFKPIPKDFAGGTFVYLYETKILEMDKTGNFVIFNFSKIKDYVSENYLFKQKITLGNLKNVPNSKTYNFQNFEANLAQLKVNNIKSLIQRENIGLKDLKTKIASLEADYKIRIKTQQTKVDDIQKQVDKYSPDFNSNRISQDYSLLSDQSYQASLKLKSLQDEYETTMRARNSDVYNIESRITDLGSHLSIAEQKINEAKTGQK